MSVIQRRRDRSHDLLCTVSAHIHIPAILMSICSESEKERDRKREEGEGGGEKEVST